MTYEVTVRLAENEMNVFQETARRNCRKPNQHARYIILKSLGLTGDEGPDVQTNTRYDAKTLAERNAVAGGEFRP